MSADAACVQQRFVLLLTCFCGTMHGSRRRGFNEISRSVVAVLELSSPHGLSPSCAAYALMEGLRSSGRTGLFW